ncbi:MAG: hypothetical protein ABI747_03650 [Candidatus Moraniibacteriota bacterium]
MSFEGSWREHTGPIGEEEKKKKEAPKEAPEVKRSSESLYMKKAANEDQFDESDLQVMSAVND